MTNNYLPSNQIEAEQSVLKSVIASMNDINEVRMSVKLKFEGLRIMPLALRLYNNLINEGIWEEDKFIKEILSDVRIKRIEKIKKL